MPFIERCSFLLIVCGLGACSDSEPYWAVQHAEVTISEESISGYQTWEFYSKKWRRNKAEKFHICARVQVVEGELVESIAGCEDCDSVYKISLEELETDCDDEVGTHRSFESASHYGLGPLNGELDEQNEHSQADLEWYISWDSEELQPMGYAWPADSEADAGLDTGVDSDSANWVLWPGYAWQL